MHKVCVHPIHNILVWPHSKKVISYVLWRKYAECVKNQEQTTLTQFIQFWNLYKIKKAWHSFLRFWVELYTYKYNVYIRKGSFHYSKHFVPLPLCTYPYLRVLHNRWDKIVQKTFILSFEENVSFFKVCFMHIYRAKGK